MHDGHAFPRLAAPQHEVYLPLQRDASKGRAIEEKETTMAVYEAHRPAAGSMSGIFGLFVSAFAGWNDARVTRAALSKLSDRELDDIGLSRGDIDMIASRG
ncbi:DUF1127 domain-containing protein [Defluviimonas aestuarii]|uniref:DUF1127 domain-containing protein n=1 Tax=Albidovulum aestuarii TaxID=1130726 RepID=UPI003014BCA6